MMQIPSVGAFVRALLPVRLTAGHTVTYGVWVAIDPRELQQVFAVWWAPEYTDVHLEGFLANSIQPWDCWQPPSVSPCAIRSKRRTARPALTPRLAQVLHDEWPHEDVLASLPN